MPTAAPNIAAENKAAASSFAKRGPALPKGKSKPRPTKAAPARDLMGLPVMLLLIVMGLTTLAACVLVPLREERRQLAHALNELEAERDHLTAQTKANAAFVERVHTDPALAERLTMRVTRRPVEGKKFLDPEPVGAFDSSPYAITKVAPPPPREAYMSDLPPAIYKLFVDTRSRVVLLAAGLLLVAAAVVLGREGDERAVAQ